MSPLRQAIERAPLWALCIAVRALAREGMALESLQHTMRSIYGRARQSSHSPCSIPP